jgi:hypothetical protein
LRHATSVEGKMVKASFSSAKVYPSFIRRLS